MDFFQERLDDQPEKCKRQIISIYAHQNVYDGTS